VLCPIEKILYRAHAKATGGRDGRVLSSDAALDVKLTRPSELGATGDLGTILSNYLPQVRRMLSICDEILAVRDKLTFHPTQVSKATLELAPFRLALALRSS